MKFDGDGTFVKSPEGFVAAIPYAYVCEYGECDRHATVDCKRKKLPVWVRVLAWIFRVKIANQWQNEPIALCEEHSYGHVVLRRFESNDGKVFKRG